MRHVLVLALPWKTFGNGCGVPKRQPAVVHFKKAHFAVLQAPPVHAVAPGEQSATVAHVEAQSLLAVQVVPRFEIAPWMQRLPPAWAGVVPVRVRVVPLHDTLVIDVPMS